jgi:transcriptional regulator GlxA family with amidase domain
MKQFSSMGPKRFGFLLLPRFSTLCLANAVEPLRAANTITGRTLYDWALLSADGGAVASSSNLRIDVDGGPGALAGLDALFVIASYGFDQVAAPSFNARLRRAARAVPVLGGLDTGPWLLARAGLLDGYRATIHWHERGRLAEDFPGVEAGGDRFVIDRDRITAGGATAVLDLMLHLIRERHGDALAIDVMQLFLYDTAHAADRPQYEPLPAPFVARAPEVARAIAVMADAVETPLAIPAIAALSNCSQRRLERAFHAALGVSPARYYLSLRLGAARRLLQETGLTVAQIAARTGFSSAAVLSRAYRTTFGMAPRDTRLNRR